MPPPLTVPTPGPSKRPGLHREGGAMRRGPWMRASLLVLELIPTRNQS